MEVGTRVKTTTPRVPMWNNRTGTVLGPCGLIVQGALWVKLDTLPEGIVEAWESGDWPGRKDPREKVPFDVHELTELTEREL